VKKTFVKKNQKNNSSKSISVVSTISQGRPHFFEHKKKKAKAMLGFLKM
jgi:hypothetical protein